MAEPDGPFEAADTSVDRLFTNLFRHHPPPPAPGTDAPVQIANVRLTTQLIGGAMVLIGSVLPWTSSFFFGSKTAFGAPMKMLFSAQQAGQVPSGFVQSLPTGFLKVAFLLVPLGAVVVVAGLRILPTVVGQVAGGIAALIAVLFVFQLQRAMDNFIAATSLGAIGIGVYVVFLGGAISAAAGLGERS
jgi:hypothetical protein